MKLGLGTLAAALVATGLIAGTAGGADTRISVITGTVVRGAEASALQLGIKGSAHADEISVGLDGTQTQFVITSTRTINPPPPPCVQISSNQIHCPTSDFVSISATLGRGGDAFSVGPSVLVSSTLSGGSGADRLAGGSGEDELVGGRGRDRINGRNGTDTLTGGAGGDVLSSGEGRDTLSGGKGSDVLRGGPGRDLLQGGPGTDVLRGGPGGDVEKE